MATDGYRTLDLQEAAHFLRMAPATLREKAKAGLIPGAKPGKRWVFEQQDLVTYLRSQYPARRRAVQVSESEENASWHCTEEVPSGGSGSRPRMDSAYASLLGLKTK